MGRRRRRGSVRGAGDVGKGLVWMRASLALPWALSALHDGRRRESASSSTLVEPCRGRQARPRRLKVPGGSSVTCGRTGSERDEVVAPADTGVPVPNSHAADMAHRNPEGSCKTDPASTRADGS